LIEELILYRFHRIEILKMTKIYLNPECDLLFLNEKQLNISLQQKSFQLSGPLLTKYFITNFAEYIAPIEINNLFIALEKSKKENFLKTEFIKVIDTLVSLKILVLYSDDVNYLPNTDKKINVLIFDLSGLINNNYVTSLNNCAKNNFNFSWVTKLDFEHLNLKEFDIIFPVYWSWSVVYTEHLNSIYLKGKVLIPIILNDLYFSLGPIIDSDESLAIAYNDLSIEKTKYSTTNYNFYRANLSLLEGVLKSELGKINIDNKGVLNKTKTSLNDRILTYNNKTNKSNLIKYYLFRKG